MTNEKGYEIEQLQHLPYHNIESDIENIATKKQLEMSKKNILSHIFSLRKENRNMQKRL